MSESNIALRINLTTGRSSLIEVDSEDSILERFAGDVRGKTIEKIGQICVREWSDCVLSSARTVVIIDAYRADNFERVDIPEELTAERYLSRQTRSQGITI
jgi:hypothetical protein